MKTKSNQVQNSKPGKPAKSTSFFQAKKEGGAFFRAQPQVKVGKPKSRFETEADQMAERAVNGERTSSLFGQISPVVQRKEQSEKFKEEEKIQRQEEEEAVQTQMEEEEEEMVQPQAEEEEVQMQEEEEEEMLQPQMEEEEEVQMQAEEEEEMVQPQAEEEELQMQEEEEEEMIQPQAEEEEVQMQAEEEEEMVQPQAEEEEVQMQEEEEEALQAKLSPRPMLHRGLDLARHIRARKGKGQALKGEVRQKMENAFQADFKDVRVHTDQDSIQMNRTLGANAFTTGKDIFFNQGKFDPSTKKGQLLLAHELTHTVQQGAVKEKKSTQLSQVPEVDSDDKTQEKNKGESAPSTEAEDTSSSVATPSPSADSDTSAPPEEETPVPRTPQDDPNFKALKGRTKKTASDQKDTPPATDLADNAGQAAPLADNETTGQAQTDQVDEMDEQEPQLFDAETFKKLLLEQIQKILPKDEEEADKFPESGKMDQVKDNAGKQVESEKEKAGGAIKNATTKEPDPNAVEARPVAELTPPKPGESPKSLRAGKVTPPARNDSEVKKPLKDDAKRMDDEMEANEVTEEQLAKSEEPSFVSALDSKKTAKANSESAPNQFRQEEQGVREKHQQKAASKGKRTVEGMFGERKELLAKVTGDQKETSKSNTSEREAISKHIDTIFQKTKDDVEKVLGPADGSKEGTIDVEVDRRFERSSKYATYRFENYIRRKMDAYKRERYGSWFDPRGWGKRVKDTFVGMPDEVNQFYVDGRKQYIADMDVELTDIAKYIATELGKVKKRIADGRKEVKDYVDSLPKNLQKLAQDAVENIEDKFSQLDSAVTAKQDALIDTIAQKYKESLEAVDARIEEMKAANRGLVDKAMDAIKGVIETIKKLKKLITDLLSAIQDLIGVIMADPIGFMKSLFAGIKAGLDNFTANIKKHLIGGLFKWLTGSLGPLGLTIPDKFDLAGIFSLVMQVLGLTWDFMRRKMVKLLGEPVVKLIEKSFAVVKMIREKGVMGLWEAVKEKFSDLKETVIDAIRNMIITQVIQAGIKWLLSLLIPGAGFIKAIMAIKDVIVFFVESAIALIPTLIDAIRAAAAKNFSGIAKAVENGLSIIIPLIISLLAKLLGISGLVKKVQKIIKRIRKRINKAVNKIILKAKAWAKKFVKTVKGKAKKVKNKIFNWWKAKTKFKGDDGKEHQLYYKGKDKNSKLTVESDPKTIPVFLAEIKPKVDQPENKKYRTPYKIVDGEFKQVRPLEKGLSDPKIKPANRKKVYAKLNGKLKKIAKNVGKLMPLLGDQQDPPAAVLPSFTNGVKARSFQAINISKKTPKGEASTANPGTLPGWKWLTATNVSYEHYNKKKAQNETLTGSVRDRDNYVRMHLLHEDLGGKATDSNLTPATTNVNKSGSDSFYHQLEKYAVDDVRKNDKVIWFKVNITYHGDKVIKGIPPSISLDPKASAFPKQVTAKYGYVEPKNGKWEKGQPTDKQFSANLPVPSFEGAAARIYNVNKEGMTGAGVDSAIITPTMAKFISDERLKPVGSGGQAKKYSDITDLLSRLAARAENRKQEEIRQKRDFKKIDFDRQRKVLLLLHNRKRLVFDDMDKAKMEVSS